MSKILLECLGVDSNSEDVKLFEELVEESDCYPLIKLNEQDGDIIRLFYSGLARELSVNYQLPKSVRQFAKRCSECVAGYSSTSYYNVFTDYDEDEETRYALNKMRDLIMENGKDLTKEFKFFYKKISADFDEYNIRK